MHPLDALAADPDRLADIEAAAKKASGAICMMSSGVIVDEAAVRCLGALLPSGAPVHITPTTHDGRRLWRLVRRFEDLVAAVHATGRGPVAPTFDEHDRAVEARRGGWLRVRESAYLAFHSLVHAGLLPPAPPLAAPRFWDALNRQDLAALRDILADGLDVGELATRRWPPVYDALAGHYIWESWGAVADAVCLLVAHGAQPNPTTQSREGKPDTAVGLALRYGDDDMADLLRRLVAAPLRRTSQFADCTAPGASGAVIIRGTDRASGGPVRVRASTVDELRAGLASLGVTRVEATGWVTVDSPPYGAGWTHTYALDELPDEFLTHAQLAEEDPNAGSRYVFDLDI